MTETVYFVTYPSGPIKIGKASNVIARMKSLQTSLPHKLELLGVLDGGPGLESSLHHKFAPIRMSGEWFRDAPELRSYISSYARPLNQERREKLARLKAPNKMVKRAFLRDRAANRRDSLENEIVALVAEVMDFWITAAREFDVALDQVEEHISAKHGSYCNFNHLRKNIRRIVDKTLQTHHWKDSQGLLLAEPEIADRVVQRFAGQFVRRRISAFLSDSEIAGT